MFLSECELECLSECELECLLECDLECPLECVFDCMLKSLREYECVFCMSVVTKTQFRMA